MYRRRIKFVPILILVLVLLFSSGVVYVGIHYLTQPKNLFLGGLQKIQSGVEELLDSPSFSHLFLSDVQLDGTVDIVFDPKLELGDGTLSLDFHSMQNKEKQKMLFDVSASYANEEMFSINSILKDRKLFYKFSDVMENYYYVDNAVDEEIMTTLTKEEVSSYISLVFEVYQKEIKNSDFTQSNTSISISGENIKVKKYEYVLTKEKDILLSRTYLDLLKENEDATSFLTKLLGVEKDELYESLEEEINELESTSSYEGETFSFYVEGFNRIVMIEFIDEDSQIQFQQRNNYLEGSFSITDEEMESRFHYVQNGVSSEFEFTSGDLEIEGTTQKIDNENMDIEFFCQYNGIILEFDGSVQNTVENETFIQSVTGGLIFKANGEKYEFGIDCSFEIGEGESIIDVTTGAKNLDNLTEEEEIQFYNEVMEVPLMKKIMEYMGAIEGAI